MNDMALESHGNTFAAKDTQLSTGICPGAGEDGKPLPVDSEGQPDSYGEDGEAHAELTVARFSMVPDAERKIQKNRILRRPLVRRVFPLRNPKQCDQLKHKQTGGHGEAPSVSGGYN